MRMRQVRRRGVVALLANFAVSACGFRPVYGPRASGAQGPAQAGLAAISVGIIPERSGQLLRQALQERFERGGAGIARRYDLVVSFAVTSEAIAIQADSSSSRTRIVGSADWKLIAQDPQRTTLVGGTARNVDGLNVLNQQYFAADLETDTVQRRVAEAVADQIAYQLAAYFNKHTASAWQLPAQPAAARPAASE